MAVCANCQHDCRAHSFHGCIRCGCSFEFRELNSACPGRFVTHTGAAMECVRRAGHVGEHEGYYPGDTEKLSHWKDGEDGVPDQTKYEDAVGSACDNANCAGSCPGCAVTPDGAREEQVGGDHYRKFKIQPWDIWLEYGLDPWLAGVVKYVLRAGRKGSKLEDLKKARHYLDRAIEIEEGGQ